MSSFVHRERVRFGDLDAMRHVNNAVSLRYFESARISYLGELQVHAPGERLCAEGYGVMVGFGYAEQQAAPLPDDIRRRLEAEVSR